MSRQFVTRLYLCTTLILTGCSSPGTETPPLEALLDLTDYRLVDPMTGRAVTVATAADRLVSADVVFLGERHQHPGNHLAQMALFRALHQRRGDVALSLEQFERDVQPILDKYLAGEIGEAVLRHKGRAWGNYPVSYRPLVEYAKAQGSAVIASEAPNMVVRCVGQQGPAFLDKLPENKRHWAAAELFLKDGPYKDRFIAFATSDGVHGKPSSEKDEVSEAVLRSFAAQVTRDDTMAESIVHYLDTHPGHQVVHLNGSFHSAAFLGTAERVKWRRPDLEVAVVHPIELDDMTSPSFSDDDRDEGTFLLLIAATPDAYASPENRIEAMKAQIQFRESVNCEL